MKTSLRTAALWFALAVAMTAAEAEEVTLAHGGLTLNANLEATGAGWQKGPVVLMTHGTLAHGRMEIMDALQAALKERGISSLSITLSLGLDNRHGMYECATPHTHRHADAVGEIGAWMGWLQAQGVGKITLLGHSRGGNQTALFAAAHAGTPVVAVILVAPQTWTEDAAAQAYRARYGKDLRAPLEQARQLAADGKGDALMGPVGFVYCPDTLATAAAFLSYYEPDQLMDTPRLIPEIKVPVLVVAAGEDELVPGLVEAVRPLADGQRVRLQVIDGADHFFRDLYSDEVADAVQAFLSGR